MDQKAHLKDFKQLFKSDSEQKEKKFKEVLKDLVESSSLHGVPKIVSSRQLAVKTLWCLLFLGTFSVLVMQLTGLFRTFYSYPIQTTVSLEFNSINFPAISICNMNPVKNSKLHMSEELMKILTGGPATGTSRKKRSLNKEAHAYDSDPKTGLAFEKDTVNLKEKSRQEQDNVVQFIQPSRVKEMKYSSNGNSEHIHQGSHDRNIFNTMTTKSYSDFSEKQPFLEPFIDTEVHRRKRDADLSSSLESSMQISSSASIMSSSVSGASGTGSSQSSYSSYASSSYYDNYYWGWGTGTGDYSQNYYDSSWSEWSDPNAYLYSQLSSKKDLWDERVEQFRTVFKNESIESRRQMGHQKEDLIMSAAFAGSLENVTNFQNFTSSLYGNCFSVSSPRYVAWRSGPYHGIKMTLNLEIDEYVSNFSTGYGIRLLLHEPGTYPLPSNEGITLGPGTETNIALKMVRISRLGKPYGDCVTGKGFAKRYRKKYSISRDYEVKTDVVKYEI